MPKIKQEEDEFEDEDELVDGEELEDELEDEDELEEDLPPRRKETRGRKPKQKEEVKRRFGILGAQPLRIVDTETNELVGEGDYAVVQALTDILERLERIEVQIGAISG